ncbi:mitochondrial carrier [Neoconidiobolus thromboides FSU 785]|nr:mitochondrial carrier [Neoconidiobolus thromboides FSU 785]
MKLTESNKHSIAGAGAGLVASVITCPLDVVKTRLQNQGVEKPGIKYYRGTYSSLKRIWFEEGIRGLYRGLGPTIMGYLPTWAIYFTAYDSFKNYSSLILGILIIILTVAFLNEIVDKPKSSSMVHIFGAMSAGALCTISTSPLWVIKTRIMTQSNTTDYRYNGTLDAFKSILRIEGIKGFYKGLMPSLLGVSHVAVQFPLYEHLKLLATMNNEKVKTSSLLLSSGIAKLVASCLTYPHEVIRTRLQNQTKKPYKYNGVINTIKIIGKEEGYRGYYKGLTTNLIRTIPASVLTIFTYELIILKIT